MVRMATSARPRARSRPIRSPCGTGCSPRRTAACARFGLAQDDDRRRREGVGPLAGDDLPPVPRRPRRAAARDRRAGSSPTTSTALADHVRDAPDLAELLERGLVYAHRSVAEHVVLRKILDTEPERLLPLLTVESAKTLPFIADFLHPYLVREAEAGRLRAGRRPRPGGRVPRPLHPVADQRARPLGPRRPGPGPRARPRRAPRRDRGVTLRTGPATGSGPSRPEATRPGAAPVAGRAVGDRARRARRRRPRRPALAPGPDPVLGHGVGAGPGHRRAVRGHRRRGSALLAIASTNVTR